LTWCHRVLCGPAKNGYALAALAAIAGGREVWGVPKHPALADLSYECPDAESVVFEGSHQGRKVISLRVQRPENVSGHVVVEVGQLTPKGSCITPRPNILKPSFVAKQTRYNQAFAGTMYFSPWNHATDSLIIYNNEAYFEALLKSWAFKPVLKMHCSDLRLAAFKPAGWDPNFKG